ncbi:hypothetical protein POM88_046298 [Heracleum sosnowskyi]|nr:hypothetical protein POM88_046298 [Heracleum sosnowskyi]
METNNEFSVDEVPLLEPHEILVPDFDPTSASSSTSFSSATSTTISMSTINSVLDDLEFLPPFEDWHTDDNHGKSYNENKGFPYDDDFTDWDSFLNDFDIDNIGHEIIQSPPDIANSPLLKIGLA